MDALVIAIDTTVDEEGQRYISTKGLQMACVDLCVSCRSYRNTSTWHIVVMAGTPRHLWRREEQDASGKKRLGSLRVPPLPVCAATNGGEVAKARSSTPLRDTSQLELPN